MVLTAALLLATPPTADARGGSSAVAASRPVTLASPGGRLPVAVEPPIREVPVRNPAPPAVVPDLPARPGIVSPNAAGNPQGYIPCDLYNAYGLNSSGLSGDQTTIAIIDPYNSTPIANDLANFDASFGLPDPPSFVVHKMSSNPTSNGAWADEITLDVEWAHAMAPRASIALVLGNTASVPDLMAAVDYAVTTLRADVVSMSFSAAESGFGSRASEDAAYGWPATNGAGRPVTYLAAAGDLGWEAAPGGVTSPGWPGTDPRVVAVGGTSLAPSAFGYPSLPGSHYGCGGATQPKGVSSANETVWGNENQNGSSGCTSSCMGTGGGPSLYEPRPAYQSGVTGNAKRVTPDVAMLADPSTGVPVFQGGRWIQGMFGGTSLATPLWAGVVALLDQARAAQGLPNLGLQSPASSWVYSSPTQGRDFNDVRTGSSPPRAGDPCLQSGLCVAQAGYDQVTGRGSPLWNNLFADELSQFVSLGGTLSSSPAAASWAAGRLDVFARGTDNTLVHDVYSGGAWSGWESLGGTLTSEPAVAAWGPNRLDVFVRGVDGALYHKWLSGGWSSWESLGGYLAAGPTVASWGPNRLDVFVRGGDNAIWHKWWDGRGWWGWESLGGAAGYSPGAVAWGPGRIDLFVQGTYNALWHKWFSGTWSYWESLGGVLSWGPAAASKGSGLLDVIVKGSGDALYRKTWTGSAWADYAAVGGGSWPMGPAVTSQPTTFTLDLFTTGSDGALWHSATS